MSKFINRTAELAELDQIADRGGATMLVVYGRRRIGKTSLLRQWGNLHPADNLYWTAYRTSEDILLESFSNQLAALTPGLKSGRLNFRTWEDALQHLFDLAEETPLIVVIDEFPYLVEMAPSFPSLLQRIWDLRKDTAKLSLAISGSHYHMMHEQFASSRKPLYGRAQRLIHLDEILPAELPLFLPRYSPNQVVETYAVTGGVPAYLELWNDRQPVWKNIEDLLISPATFFSQEAILLIQDEISQPRTYLSILQAIGAGLKTPKQISDITGISLSHMGKYLSVLAELRFIRRVLSEDSADRVKSRNTKYEIRDAYLRFHFEFLYPYPDLRESRNPQLNTQIQRAFPAFVGSTSYEELSRRQLLTWSQDGELSFTTEFVGRAWNRKAEIDVVGINWKDRVVLFGECKWTATKMNASHLEALKTRAALLTKFNGFTKQYALFSKSGFAKSLKEKPDDALLVSGGNLERIAN